MQKRAKKKPEYAQGILPFKQHGGYREEAGRKPGGKQSGVSHQKRPVLKSRHPVHATTKVSNGRKSLRSPKAFAVIKEVFRNQKRHEDFRIIQYSVLGNHIHLIVEAEDQQTLSQPMQGMLVSIAKRLNKLWNQSGSVFRDRYHMHVLTTPREVKNALRYVLNNHLRHSIVLSTMLDRCASGHCFDGWRELSPCPLDPALQLTSMPKTWLFRVGWKRHGPISCHARPGRLQQSG